MTNGKQLPVSHMRLGRDLSSDLKGGRQVYYHGATMGPLVMFKPVHTLSNNIVFQYPVGAVFGQQILYIIRKVF